MLELSEKDPLKRFYEQVQITQVGQAYEVILDGRSLKTPMQRTLHLPTEALAQKIADEWSNIETEINIAHMPIFSLAVTAIDMVSFQKAALSTEIQNYIMNDLLCYRETEDKILQGHQNKNWDPWLKWSKKEFDFELKLTKGVMPIYQDERNKTLLFKVISEMSVWYFMCFMKATTLAGSAVLALAFIKKQLKADELFSLCFLDELYQVKRWGEDEEALKKRNAIKTEFYNVSEFLKLVDL